MTAARFMVGYLRMMLQKSSKGQAFFSRLKRQPRRYLAGRREPVIDPQGNLYVITGDGEFDAYEGGADYGDTFLKLRLAAGESIVPLDYFTPFDQKEMDVENLISAQRAHGVARSGSASIHTYSSVLRRTVQCT